MENNCNSIYEWEWLLTHLVRPTSKEKKITQYDVVRTILHLFKINDQCVFQIYLLISVNEVIFYDDL